MGSLLVCTLQILLPRVPRSYAQAAKVVIWTVASAATVILMSQLLSIRSHGGDPAGPLADGVVMLQGVPIHPYGADR